MVKRNFFEGDVIRPRGWVRRQLEIQASSLSGHLDFIWDDIKKSSWIGGSAEGWERLPYWLDGFIPLAYLLEDRDLIERARGYIRRIVDGQRRDGWLCPTRPGDDKYDTWALLLMSKVLTEYYRISGDETVPEVIYNAMKNYRDLLRDGKIRLFGWGKARWFEGFIALDFLWERYGEEWIRDLARILRDQGTDYASLTWRWKRPLRYWHIETHIVNMAMMLKAEAVSSDLLGEEYTDLASRLYDVLSEYNGSAIGTINGDEVLAGTFPNHGAELCSVVELMYSLELLYARTGEAKWAELLESVAFNALPATFTDDMWAHQYDQMANQIACVRFPGQSPFTTNGADAHLFGFDPEYGCCTANFSQGWPKLVQSAFLWLDDEVLCAVPVPCSVDKDGTNIVLDTDFPFENTLRFTVDASCDFTLAVRVPSYSLDLTVNGEAAVCDEVLRFAIGAGEHREITVSFRTEAKIVDRPHGMAAVKCGPLVYSLPIEYSVRRSEPTRNGLHQIFPYCTYEFLPESEWRWGISSVDSEPVYHGIGDIPFSSKEPPISLKARLRRVEWDYEYGYDTLCAAYPEDTTPIGEETELSLVPYGATILRMTELPRLD